MSTIDPRRCPLCGGDNTCALAGAAEHGTGGYGNAGCNRAPGEGTACGSAAAAGCWCNTVAIPAAVLARVPAATRDRACLCRRCAAGDGSATVTNDGAGAPMQR